MCLLHNLTLAGLVSIDLLMPGEVRSGDTDSTVGPRPSYPRPVKMRVLVSSLDDKTGICSCDER